MCPRAHDTVAEWSWGQIHSLIVLCSSFTFILITMQYSPCHNLREEGSKTLNKLAYGYIAGMWHSRDPHEFYIYSKFLHSPWHRNRRKVRSNIFIIYTKQKLHWAILTKQGQFYLRLLQQGKETRNSNPLKQKKQITTTTMKIRVVLRAGRRRL